MHADTSSDVPMVVKLFSLFMSVMSCFGVQCGSRGGAE